jgi:hypothetical protein
MCLPDPGLCEASDYLARSQMHHRSELGRLARRFLRHLRRGDTAQFVIDEREQFF